MATKSVLRSSISQVRKKAGNNKDAATKLIHSQVYSDTKTWTVHNGELVPKTQASGEPSPKDHLFKVVGEKLPFECLPKVRAHMKAEGLPSQGVYVAHDSMGCPRYIGRGLIFARLESRHKAQPLELEYFSFYVVSEKKHEREVETLLIRTAGFLLEFNTRKKRIGLSPGSIKDYEAGTIFYERQRKKGVARKSKKV